MLENIKKATKYIQERYPQQLDAAVVLGSGLAGFAKKMSLEVVIPYTDIPCFPTSTVKGHSGCLHLGKYKNIHTAILEGRFHHYEGYDLAQVTFPIRVLKMLGIHTLLLSNAEALIQTFQLVTS